MKKLTKEAYSDFRYSIELFEQEAENFMVFVYSVHCFLWKLKTNRPEYALNYYNMVVNDNDQILISCEFIGGSQFEELFTYDQENYNGSKTN